MQKKLIAAAVAGLLAVPAMAQTNVTISGRFATGWESYKLSGPATGYDTESKVSDQSSRIIFSVVEDLGGGLKAWGQVDSRFANDSGAVGGGTGWAAGNSGVGLMGGFGKIGFGRWDVHYSEMIGLEANRAGSLQSIVSFGLMSQVNGVTIANGTRSNNFILWDSPNWNGLTARLGYSTAWVANAQEGQTNRAAGDPGAGRAWTGAVRYNNGPIMAGLSYWNGNQENRVAATTDQRSTRLWFGYNFAMGLKLGLEYDRSSLKNSGAAGNNTRSAWMIPVSYAFGPHKVYFNYARAGKTSNVVNSKGKQWGLGYDYGFSNRTSMGVYYTKVSNDKGGSYDMFGLGANGATATNAGEDARQLYIGIAHNF